MPKEKKLMVRLPLVLAEQVAEIAAMSLVAPSDIIKVAIAMDVRKWNRESGIRAERDAAVDTLRKIAAGKRRTREQRLALSCVTLLDECSNVPPNA